MSDDEGVESPAQATATRVAQCGAFKPVEGLALVREQMRYGHDYYNQLIAMERARRAAYRALRDEVLGEDLESYETKVEELATKLDELRTAIKGERQEARGRVKSALSVEARNVANTLKEARAALNEMRKTLRDDPVFKAAIAEMDERAGVLGRALRANTKSFWGSYLLAEASVKQAQKARVDPTFRRWRGEGRIGVQIQGGMTFEDAVHGQDTRFRLVPVAQDMRLSERTRKHRIAYHAWVRVGSTEVGRQPVWTKVPVVFDRPLPETAQIKWVTLHLRQHGLREKWSLSIVYTYVPVPMPMKAGAVALDLGWRKRKDRLRTAYWVDDQGGHGEIALPDHEPVRRREKRGRRRGGVRQRLAYTRVLREIQDKRFNLMQARLVRWVKAARVRGLPLPGFLAEVEPFLAKIKSHGRLRKLAEAWKHLRFQGDRLIFEALWEFRQKSRHLYQWEYDQRSRALGYRRDIYRCCAKKIAERYGTVVIEDFDLSRVKRRKHAESEEGDAPRAQRYQLQLAAPGELRSAIVNAVAREGGLVVKVSATGTTSACHACGGVCVWDQAEYVTHVCEHCGVTWDQDFNAAANLLRGWRRGDLPDTTKKPTKKGGFRKKPKEQTTEGP